MKITRRALVRKVGPSTVTLDNPEIRWEKDRVVVRQAKVNDGTAMTPTTHNYEIEITLEEFRQMLRAFTR
jgi:hypothetical protein